MNLSNYFVCIEDKDYTSDNYSSFKTTFDGLLKLRDHLFEDHNDFIDLKLKIHEITSSKALLNIEVLSALKKINDIKEIEIIKKDYMYLLDDTYPFFNEAFNNFGTESDECIKSLSESLSKLCEFKQKLNIKDINYEKLDKLIDVFKCHFNESCTEYEFKNCITEYQNHVDTINPIDHTLLSIENQKEWYKKFKSQFETLNKYNRQLITFNCSSQELTSLINNYRSFLNYFHDEIFSCCDNSFDILNSFCDFFGNLFDGMAIFLDECTPKNKRYEYNYQIVRGEVRIKKIFTN